jgi:HPt (histidine-containing phosphotransfer) domain-containing protein
MRMVMTTMTENPLDKRAFDRLEKLGGKELIVRVIDQFLEKTPQRMDAACDRGLAGDLAALENAVGSIKSAAGNIGATELYDIASRIEQLAKQGTRDLVLPMLCHLEDMLGQVQTWLVQEKSSLRYRGNVH